MKIRILQKTGMKVFLGSLRHSFRIVEPLQNALISRDFLPPACNSDKEDGFDVLCVVCVCVLCCVAKMRRIGRSWRSQTRLSPQSWFYVDRSTSPSCPVWTLKSAHTNSSSP